MTEEACRLDNERRRLVEATIEEHCTTRGWTLFAVNCRSNHVHVIVASRKHRKTVRSELKAWCTRALKELEGKRCGVSEPSTSRLTAKDALGNSGEVVIRTNWWAERGSAFAWITTSLGGRDLLRARGPGPFGWAATADERVI